MTGATAITVSVMETARLGAPELEWLQGCLPACERDRADRFLRPSDQCQYVAAHALTRLMLARATGDAGGARSLRFLNGPQGKPSLEERSSVRFNLSHCHGLVACAICRRVEIGVDIEAICRDAPFEVEEACFTPRERDRLSRLSADERRETFFRLWTLKEAFIKATGRGLSQPLTDFGFDLDPIQVRFLDPRIGDAAAWSFHQERLETGHFLALAWQAGTTRLPVRLQWVTTAALASCA